MMSPVTGSALYNGVVVHKRMRPVQHALRYHVFSLLLDCDELAALDQRLKLFSYNRFNVLSLHDRDHGDGSALRRYLRRIAAQSGQEIDRFLMLCYPRMLGYGFNPVTVYFGLAADERLKLMIYEVNNTFGERKSYVIPVPEEAASGIVSQGCRKSFYVSPFNAVEGRYKFHLTPLGEDVTVGVALENDQGPVLKAYFRGSRSVLSDASLLVAVLRTGWLSVKVIAAIHFEALKLRLKGLRLQQRPPAPRSAIDFVHPQKQNQTS
ncbi:MAG: DUF1365 domain-containing protein [Alphaproteobacteria bacterium]